MDNFIEWLGSGAYYFFQMLEARKRNDLPAATQYAHELVQWLSNLVVISFGAATLVPLAALFLAIMLNLNLQGLQIFPLALAVLMLFVSVQFLIFRNGTIEKRIEAGLLKILLGWLKTKLPD